MTSLPPLKIPSLNTPPSNGNSLNNSFNQSYGHSSNSSYLDAPKSPNDSFSRQSSPNMPPKSPTNTIDRIHTPGKLRDFFKEVKRENKNPSGMAIPQKYKELIEKERQSRGESLFTGGSDNHERRQSKFVLEKLEYQPNNKRTIERMDSLDRRRSHQNLEEEPLDGMTYWNPAPTNDKNLNDDMKKKEKMTKMMNRISVTDDEDEEIKSPGQKMKSPAQNKRETEKRRKEEELEERILKSSIKKQKEETYEDGRQNKTIDSPALVIKSKVKKEPVVKREEMDLDIPNDEEEQKPKRRMPTPEGTSRCEFCDRTFQTDRLERHQNTCPSNPSKKKKQRKVMDGKSIRLSDTEFKNVPKREVDEKKIKKVDWRKQHETFIENIRAAKEA